MNFKYHTVNYISEQPFLHFSVFLRSFKDCDSIFFKVDPNHLIMKQFLIFATMFLFSYSCLITNCPRGGKRGVATLSFENIVKECPSCGPNHLGKCFGPYICCGPYMGCLIGTPETYKCRSQNQNSTPCIAGYSMCRGNTARCAANGICCSQESCHMDAKCKIIDTIGIDRKTDNELNVILPENEISTDIISQ